MSIPAWQRRPRKAKPLAGSDDAWWYANDKSIDVFIRHASGGTTACQIPLKQLAKIVKLAGVKA